VNSKKFKTKLYYLAKFILFFFLFVDYLIASPFKDNGDGTLKDYATKLVWQKCSMGVNNDTTCSGVATTISWANALSYCSSLSLASLTWRLPHINELKSIIDVTKLNPSIDTTAFPSTGLVSYWSSTTYSFNTANAFQVLFSAGYVNFNNLKSGTAHVRCVSGP
jgi:hypothetical protein